MRLTKKEIEEGQKIPFGYGRAYWDFSKDVRVVYLIPFNLIVVICRNFYYLLVKGLRDKFSKLKRNIYQEGFDRGYHKGQKETEKYLEEKFDVLARLQKYVYENTKKGD